MYVFNGGRRGNGGGQQAPKERVAMVSYSLATDVGARLPELERERRMSWLSREGGEAERGPLRAPAWLVR
jgi:hypothetical protein